MYYYSFLRRISLIFFVLLSMNVYSMPEQNLLDFSKAVIVIPKKIDKSVQKIATVLQEEIQKRTGIKLDISYRWPNDSKSIITLGLHEQRDQFAGLFAKELKNITIPGDEGFCLWVKDNPQNVAIISGKDNRGIFYGVGRLLRKMVLRDRSIMVPADLNMVSAPKYPLRGHQLGYRPKTNSYDAWSVIQFDQYIRELVLFGNNSIEILPPITDDDLVSEHMKVPALEMMSRLSEIIDGYGMDVWIWYPNVGKDYVSPEGIKNELTEREEIFKNLKRIDHILIPGGDPGRLHPDELFPFVDKMSSLLHKYHPKARIWISPQSFDPTKEWLDSFFTFVNQKPSWLEGVVFAPWVKTTLPELRERVNKDLPIRRYPDITHNVVCQYPVPDWDLAFALTLHRECFNPRPLAMKTIHNKFDEYACGTITYSEGINDDINKFIWSDQDWDPNTSVIETLRDYCRLFISADYDDEIAQGFMMQEQNWEGPLAANDQVERTLLQWQALEEKVGVNINSNYRFQMGLMRAYYDAYIKQRLVYETLLENEAKDWLRQAKTIGSLEAIKNAQGTLNKASLQPVAIDYRQRCEALADSLFKNIGCQLSVKKHGAKSRTRGAFMDGIDEPLNDIAWLTYQFAEINKLEKENEKLSAIDRILNRTNPGPGGFYDNMGTPTSKKRIKNSISWQEDPGTLDSPRFSFNYTIDNPEEKNFPLSWKNQVTTIYETPLVLFYDHLDPLATYSLKVAYVGRITGTVRLVADEKYTVHDFLQTGEAQVREFRIPKAATEDGYLELKWTCGAGQRGTQVAEIWLIKN